MLPVLLFELVWKSIWLVAVALPLWSADQLDAATRETIKDCLFGVILMPFVIPWPYVFAHYVKQPGERWTALITAERVPTTGPPPPAPPAHPLSSVDEVYALIGRAKST
jgi:hypothetical protein